MKYISFGLVKFYGMSTIVGYLMPNFISREKNIVLKIYKFLLRSLIKYFTRTLAPVTRHGV